MTRKSEKHIKDREKKEITVLFTKPFKTIPELERIMYDVKKE